ncbi:MAG TPA: condensation domain-containing protein [Candidatus Angelobacter sp.]
MSIAHSVSAHNYHAAEDALSQIQRAYPEMGAQDAFQLPTWYYKQNEWIENSVGSENALYNFPIAVRITGALDVAILRQCLLEVQRRHDVLRSVLRPLNGHVFQVIVPPRDLTLEIVDLTNLPQPARDAQLANNLSEETERPFELTTNLLLRARLWRLGVAEYVLQITTHHLVCDDWSSGILITELFALYDSYAAGTGKRLPELKFHYGDFIRWQQRRAQDDVRRQALWKARLSASKGFYHIHPDSARPHRRTRRGARINYILPAQLEAALKRLAQQNSVTFFMVLLAGFQSLLHLLSTDTDIGVGTCAANRPLPEVEKLVGRFANDLVVRTDFSGDPSFREILSRTRDSALEGYGYQDLPFGAVLEELVPVADPSATPLFQSIFILQNAPKTNSHNGSITAERIWFDTRTAKYDLAVWVRMEEGVEIAFEYNRDLFRAQTITHMTLDYETVLAAMVADPDKRVSQVHSSLGRMQAEPEKSTSNGGDRSRAVFPEKIEEELKTLWREVLGVNEICATDDFFALGGDSLRATQLLRRVEQRFGARILLRSLFSSRTIQQQALAIAQGRRGEPGADQDLRSVDERHARTVSESTSPTRVGSIHKSFLRRATNRFLHLLCRFLPGATTLRPFLHRLRGMKIGKDVWIGDDVYLENEYPECVEIHDGAMIGLRSTIVAHTRGAGKIIIGRDAFIGAGSTLVTTGNRPLIIGEGAVLMASSLVTGNIAPHTLYGRDAAKPLARVTKPFTASTTYEEFMSTLRPLSR